MSRSKKPLLSLSYLSVGFLFLCNPNISIFDILPDAVGYFFIVAAITDMSDLNHYFAEAKKRFLYLAWLNVGKVLALFLLLRILAINADQTAMISVFSLGFAVVECLFIFPAISALWTGFSYIGERDGILSVLPPLKNLFPYSYLFFAIKHFGSFLPELVLASVGHLNSFENATFQPMKLYPLLLFLAFVAVLVVGIYWLGLCRAYLKALKENEDFSLYLTEKEEKNERVLKAGRFFRQKSRVLFVLLAAFLLGVDFIINQNNLLPDALCGVCFLLFFLLVRKEDKSAKWGIYASLSYTLSSLAFSIFQYIYTLSYDYTAASYVRKAARLYSFIKVSAVWEAVSLAFVLLLLYRVLSLWINKHTGLSLETEQSVFTPSALQRELRKKNKILLTLGFLPALFHVIEVFLLSITLRHIVTEEEANAFYHEGQVLYFSRFEGSFWITLVLSLIWIVYGLLFILRLREEMRMKYCDFIDNT